jgi:hypothetical protein
MRYELKCAAKRIPYSPNIETKELSDIARFLEFKIK